MGSSVQLCMGRLAFIGHPLPSGLRHDTVWNRGTRMRTHGGRCTMQSRPWQVLAAILCWCLAHTIRGRACRSFSARSKRPESSTYEYGMEGGASGEKSFV